MLMNRDYQMPIGNALHSLMVVYKKEDFSLLMRNDVNAILLNEITGSQTI